MPFNPVQVCFVGFTFIIGFVFIYTAVSKYFLMQKIKNTPTSKVRSAALGLVELYGKAKYKEPITSPITKTKCVFWRLVAEYYQSGKHGGRWCVFYKKDASSEFYLEDDTGRILVSPKNAIVEIPPDNVYTGHLSDRGFFGLLPQQQLDKKVLEFLDEHPEAKLQFRIHSNSLLRVSEYYINEDDRVYVLGTAEVRTEAGAGPANENLIICMGRDNVMYISDQEEKHITEKIKWEIIGWLAVGLLICGMCVPLIIINFMT